MSEAPVSSAFDGDMGVIARLLAMDGFRLGRGTSYYNGGKLPTLVIDRPDRPDWIGRWGIVVSPHGEAFDALELAGVSMDAWNEVLSMEGPG